MSSFGTPKIWSSLTASTALGHYWSKTMTTTELYDPEDIIGELRADVGVLLYVAGSSSQVEQEEIDFVAEQLSEAVERLQTAWYKEEKRRWA